MSGSLAHSPPEILQKALVALSLGTLPSSSQGSSDWPIWYGTLPNDPDNAIFCQGTAGIPDGRIMNDGEQQEHFGVTVTVRSNSYADGYAKARAIKTNLDENILRTSVTVSANVYLVHSISTRPGPLAIGKEEASKRELFTINMTMNVEQTT